jgi:photosystem II stability/assembly factor-like uncharacterized protein
MTTKQILPVFLLVCGGMAFLTLRTLRAHAVVPAAAEPDEVAELDEVDDDLEDEEDRALTSIWSDKETAFAVGERGAVYHSTDGGRVWVRQETGVDEDLHAVWGVRGNVFAVGEAGRILRQKAEGVWESLVSGVDEDLHVVWGSSGDDVWAAGDGGVVLHSRDGGATWKRVNSGTDEDLRGIAGAPGGVIISGSSGVVKKLKDVQAISTSGGPVAIQG